MRQTDGRTPDQCIALTARRGSRKLTNFVSFMLIYCALYRKIAGPHICGDSIDIDPARDQILTGSWRKDNPLQVSSL